MKIKNFTISKKALEMSVLFGLLCAVFISFADFDASCDELRNNVLRLHIIANSDSAEDQALKLKIRDRILSESGNLFEGDNNLDSAITTAKGTLEKFEAIANEVIKENGFGYGAKARIGTAYFETRVYDEFTLPAGNYESLIINVGESRGKNWWCVIFPQVCIPAAGDAKLSDSVGESGVKVAENPRKYVMRFKTVEIYEDIKHLLSK